MFLINEPNHFSSSTLRGISYAAHCKWAGVHERRDNKLESDQVRGLTFKNYIIVCVDDEVVQGVFKQLGRVVGIVLINRKRIRDHDCQGVSRPSPRPSCLLFLDDDQPLVE